MSDKLSRLEKSAVALSMAAQGLIVARWYAGDTLNQTVGQWVIAWLITLFAVAAGLSLDLAVVVTTISRREGRRSWWSHAAAGSAATFSALIALDVYGGPTPGPWLHVANAVTTFCLIQHLATPRTQDSPARLREIASAWKAKADELAGTVETLQAALSALQSAPAPATVPSSAPQAVRVVENQGTAPANVERTAPAHQTGTIQVERTKAETWQTIMNALTAPTPRSLSAIGADLGISESMVRKHRTEMEQAGLLVRNGKTYSKNGVALEVI